ncbi:hypothetical protein F66182_338 [Fusarium sp. NRRL 66182]|nr:hypothetical protein F66182_338 [Fusarium sp. NRRL 66182]
MENEVHRENEVPLVNGVPPLVNGVPPLVNEVPPLVNEYRLDLLVNELAYNLPQRLRQILAHIDRSRLARPYDLPPFEIVPVNKPWPIQTPYTAHVVMTLTPDPHATSFQDFEWVACMCLCVKDLALLMRDSLRWSRCNVVEGGGFITSTGAMPSAVLLSAGFPHARHYDLIDRNVVSNWKGGLWVFGRSVNTVSMFALEDMSVANVARMWAGNSPILQAYYYDAKEEEVSFNAIYEDTGLEGWWPWPRLW